MLAEQKEGNPVGVPLTPHIRKVERGVVARLFGDNAMRLPRRLHPHEFRGGEIYLPVKLGDNLLTDLTVAPVAIDANSQPFLALGLQVLFLLFR